MFVEPKGIFKRFMEAGVAADRQAIVVIGEAMQEGSAFVATFGTMGMKYGHLATEDETYNHDPPHSVSREPARKTFSGAEAVTAK